ncbi:glycosyltransferase family 4 protein [Patescibacteria group bacterium]|nr:glycosyltransferase family 4 protein [Patescibacteria group bacterium]
MKIGFDITTLSMPKTGIGQYQYNLLEALFEIDKKNSYNLYAFNLRDNQKYNQLNFAKKYENVQMNAYKIPQRLITAWWMMFRWPLLENITDKCDVYQVSEICQQPTKSKTTAFIHDLTTVLYPEYHLKKNKILFDFRAKGIKKYADAVLTNSEYTKSDIIKHLGIEKERIFVTPFAAHKRFHKINDNEKTNEILKKHAISKPYICYLGTIEPRKNLANLFEAFNALKKQEKIPHKLVLIGKNGWFFEEIYKKAKELGIENEIINTGNTLFPFLFGFLTND